MLGMSLPDSGAGGSMPTALPPESQKSAQGRKFSALAPMTLMFTFGSDNNELKRCLMKIRLPLIAAGIKADNLPPDHQGRLKLVSGLSGPAMKHVREWFRKNGEFEDLPDPIQACSELSSESAEWDSDPEQYRHLWRSVLSAFAQGEHTEMVERFLHPNAFGAPPAAIPKSSPRHFELTEADAKDMLNAVNGSSLALAEGQGARAVIRGILASLARDFMEHDRAVASLRDMKLPLADRFIEVLDALREQPQHPATAAAPAGVRTLISLSDARLDDLHSLTVLGKFKHRIESGRFFIHIAAIVQGEDVIALSDDELKDIFKETGDATADRNTVHIGAAEEQSLMIWRVDHERPEEKSQYVVKERIGRTYTVVDLPHSSNEPDHVREWIKEVYQPVAGVFPVFRLSDGPMIKFSNDNTDTAKANFEEPLSGYRSHPAIKWHGRHIVVSPFGAADFRYDCAPPRSVVKRLFKTKTDLSTVPPLTKRQVADLAEMASQYANDDTIRKSIARAQIHLDTLFETREMLDEFMGEIIALPVVQASIGSEIERQVADARGGVEIARKNLDMLAIEKKRVQGEIEALKAAHKKELPGMAREVRLAFEHAGAEGYKSLAAISLFKHALGLEERLPSPETAIAGRGPVSARMPVPAISQVRGKRLSATKDLDQAIELQCGRNGLSPRMLRTFIAAAASSGLVALAGENPGKLTSALVSILCGGIGCTVSVTGDMFSMSDLMNAPALAGPLECPEAVALGEFIAQCQHEERACVVRLRGANRMPPESIFPELIDFAGNNSAAHAIAWTDGSGTPRSVHKKAPVVFVAELVPGRSVFPIAGSLAWQIALIDTTMPWGDFEEVDDEMPVHYSFVDSTFYSTLAGKAAAKASHMIESLPTPAHYDAARMARAAIAAGLTDAEASLVSYMPFALGRVKPDDLEAVLKQSGGQLASNFKTYAAHSDRGQYFDMGSA